MNGRYLSGAVRWYTAKISDAVFHARQSGWDALFCRIVIKTVGYCGGFDGKKGGFFMRKREEFVKQAAIFAAAALVVPAAVQAKEDPGEELEEILETQMEQGEKSLLSKTLGLDELQENMEEDGFSVQTKFGVSRETWELLGVEAPTSEDGYLQMNLRAAEDAERWQFDLEAATDKNTKFLTLSLYADEDQLAVSIPQFYDGALAIRSGSLLQQYNGSWLEQMLDQPLEEDVDLSFVPGEQEEDETQEDDSWELVKDAARVEKSEQGDETVYSVIVPTETFLDFCQEQYETLIEQLSGVATVTEYGDPNEFFACLKNAMEEELTLDFYTRHGFVTNVALEATIDTAEFEEYRKELREEGAPDGPTASFWVSVPGFHTEVGGMQEDTAGQNTDAASDIIGGADGSTDIYLGSTGVITEKLSFAFTDPENPNAGFESSLKFENGEKKITVELSGERKQTKNTETYTLHLTQSDDDGINFDEDFYNVSFNAETGEYDGVLNFGEEVGMIGLDAAFTEIKAGESFDLRVDGLTIADETGAGSINGTVSVQASPGELKAPENEKMFFELTEAQLLNLVMEIQGKGTAWQEKFMPEQSETEDALYGKDYAYGEHETGEEEETDYGTDSALPGDGYRADEGNGNQPEQDGEQNAEQPGYNGEQSGAYPENSNGDHPEAAPSGDTAVA